MMKVNPGDLVRTHDHGNEMFGIVLSTRPMENCFRDSCGKDQIYICSVLMNKDLPGYLGNGRIAELTDSILEVINETW